MSLLWIVDFLLLNMYFTYLELNTIFAKKYSLAELWMRRHLIYSALVFPFILLTVDRPSQFPYLVYWVREGWVF